MGAKEWNEAYDIRVPAGLVDAVATEVFLKAIVVSVAID